MRPRAALTAAIAVCLLGWLGGRADRLSASPLPQYDWLYVMNADGSNVRSLSTAPGRVLHVSWSPDGKQILAAIAGRDEDWDIWLTSADGSSPVNLTRSPGYDGRPAFSPDGKWIAFDTQRDGNLEVYVMRADGTGLRRLTTDPAIDADASWSPDGRRIAFVSRRGGAPGGHYYVMNRDGSGQRRLSDLQAHSGAPAWSPDGRSLAVAGRRDGRWELYLLDPDTGREQRLTRSLQDEAFPRWSTDGRHILFDAGGALGVLELKEGRLSYLKQGDYTGGGQWSPDGRCVAYVQEAMTIWTSRADGTEARRLTESMEAIRAGIQSGGPWGPRRSLAWSPDGKQLAFVWERYDEEWPRGGAPRAP